MSEVDDARVEDEIDPTDEELSLALDEAFEERPIEETPSPETEETEEPEETTPEILPPEDDLSHGEKSRLGRKVAYLEEKVATKDDLNDILKRLNDLAIGINKPKEEFHEEEFHEEEDIQTPEGLDRFLEKREQQKVDRARKEQFDYEKKYVGVLDTLLADVADQKARDGIRSEMVKKGSQFNIRLSNDPSSDCARNFNKAFLFVNKPAKAETVFDKTNRTPKVPSGVTGSSTTDKTAPILKYELDEYERAAAKGLSIEEINSALEEESPVGVRSRARNVR